MPFTTVCPDDPKHQGLVRDLDKLSYIIQSTHNPPVDKFEKVLQYLDVCRIPTTDKPTEKDERAVDLALSTLLVICGCEPHLKRSRTLDASLGDIWPSLWKWLEFLDAECCQKCIFGAALNIRGLVGISHTLSTFGVSEALRQLATSTPGVITMLSRYWLAEGQHPGIEHLLNAAGISRNFTRTLDVFLQVEDTTPYCLLPDIIAAAPGGAKSVARIGILHLNNDASKEHPDFLTIYRDLSLINNFFCKSCPALHLALLNHGIIPTMVKMLTLFNAQTMDNINIIHCIKMCYFILIWAFQSANGTSWIIQAFDSGLLPVLLKSGRRLVQLDKFNRNLCTTLLSDILCQYLVYRSVLCSIGKVLRRVERLNIDQDVAGPLWDEWLLFKDLAHERIDFVIQVENDNVGQNGCNRIGCDQTDEADSLLRCSRCLSTLYCGRNCQRLDWPSHKSSCQELKCALQEGLFTPVSESDTHFIARLVMKDVFAHLEKLLSYIKEHGKPTLSISSLAVNLNYTAVPVTVTVVPVSELLGIDDYWDSLIQQAQESGGDYIFARAEVRRGDLVPSVANLIPAPVRRGL